LAQIEKTWGEKKEGENGALIDAPFSPFSIPIYKSLTASWECIGRN
jgi:hypothetical protein